MRGFRACWERSRDLAAEKGLFGGLVGDWEVFVIAGTTEVQAKKRNGRVRSRALTTDAREAVVIQFERT
jgi:hypothetical protein